MSKIVNVYHVCVDGDIYYSGSKSQCQSVYYAFYSFLKSNHLLADHTLSVSFTPRESLK